MKLFLLAITALLFTASASASNFGFGSANVPTECDSYPFADGRLICIQAYAKGCDVTPDSKFCVKKASIFESKSGDPAPWLVPPVTGLCPTTIDWDSNFMVYSMGPYDDITSLTVSFDAVWSGVNNLQFDGNGPTSPDSWLSAGIPSFSNLPITNYQPADSASWIPPGGSFPGGFTVDLTSLPITDDTVLFMPNMNDTFIQSEFTLSNVVITCTQ